MGSVCEAAEEVVDYLSAKARKVGLLKVHLYRPFAIDKFLEAIPATCKKIAVLDRTKEPGALGEPLYQDVCTAFFRSGKDAVIVGGRYGLGSKDVTPAQIISVYNNLSEAEPKTISLSVSLMMLQTFLCQFFRKWILQAKEQQAVSSGGLGADGTVSANKNSIKIIGDHTDMYAQAYFSYDSKNPAELPSPIYVSVKIRSVLHTMLRQQISLPATIRHTYICNDMLSEIKDGGTFLLNTVWGSIEELDANLPASMKRMLAEKHIKFYTINATKFAQEIGLGNRSNTTPRLHSLRLPTSSR